MPYACAEKKKEYMREYYRKRRENPDEVQRMIIENRRWKRENKEQNAEINRVYRKNNYEEQYRKQCLWRDVNREKVRQYDRDYRDRHKNHDEYKARMKNQNAFRRSKVTGSGVSAKDWQDMLRTFMFKCIYCQVNDATEQDHIIPLSKGGWHSLINIAPSCRSCNAQKRNTELFDWRPDLVGALSFR